MQKRVVVSILVMLILAASVFFLWPRSLADFGEQAESIRVELIENQEVTTFTYNSYEPEFQKIMEILGRYSYHMTLRTISSYFEDSTSMEGNQAGFWLSIDLYTEPDCFGDYYYGGITSGGTGEVIVGDGIYRIGYWGNGKPLEMMEEFYQYLLYKGRG